jgi:hypothetical protein
MRGKMPTENVVPVFSPDELHDLFIDKLSWFMANKHLDPAQLVTAEDAALLCHEFSRMMVKDILLRLRTALIDRKEAEESGG